MMQLGKDPVVALKVVLGVTSTPAHLVALPGDGL